MVFQNGLLNNTKSNFTKHSIAFFLTVVGNLRADNKVWPCCAHYFENFQGNALKV